MKAPEIKLRVAEKIEPHANNNSLLNKTGDYGFDMHTRFILLFSLKNVQFSP